MLDQLAPDLLLAHVELALEQPGCPICRLVAQGEEKFFWLILWENTTEPVVRDDFRERRGHCPPHLQRFRARATRARLGSAGVSLFLGDLCLAVAEDLDRTSPRIPFPSCSPCARARVHTRRLAEALLLNLHRSSFHTLYAASEGICVPHLAAVQRVDRTIADLPWLASHTAARGRSLEQGTSPARLVRWLSGDSHGETLDAAAPRGSSHPIASNATLQDLLAKPGCALCNVAARAERMALGQCLDAAHREASAPTQNDGSLGACGHHWTALLCLEQERFGSQAGTVHLLGRAAAQAIVHIDALSNDSREALARSAARNLLLRLFTPRPTPPAFAPLPPCHFCAHLASLDARAAAAFGHLLAEEAFAHRAQQSDGLCLPHLRQVLTDAQPTAARTLATFHAERLRAIAVSLAEFQRKSRWEARHEAKGDEQRAPASAMRFFTGEALG